MKLQWKLTKVEKGAGGEGFTLTYDTAAGVRTVNAKSVVSTAPAHALKGVLTPVLPQADELCDKIRSEVGLHDSHHQKQSQQLINSTNHLNALLFLLSPSDQPQRHLPPTGGRGHCRVPQIGVPRR